jgi:hypothetical protein
LILDEPGHCYMQHRLTFLVLEVHISAHAYQSLDVVLFNAHNGVVKWCRPIIILHIWIEFGPHIFQIVESHYALSLLCGTMKYRKTPVREHAKLCLVTSMEYLKYLKVTEEAREVHSSDASWILYVIISSSDWTVTHE